MKAADRQILHGDAMSFSIRSIAKECGIAAGTVYNYFPSKEDLIAEVMLEDWKEEYQKAAARCESTLSFESGIDALFDALYHFQEKYSSFYRNYHSSSLTEGYGKRHVQLKKQLQEILEKLFIKFGLEEMHDISSLLAEAVIACASQPDLSRKDLHALCAHLIIQEKG